MSDTSSSGILLHETSMFLMTGFASRPSISISAPFTPSSFHFKSRLSNVRLDSRILERT